MHKRLRAQLLGLLLLGGLTVAPFYLGICNQKVALYETHTGRCHITETPVHSLPEADQQALRNGIPLESMQAAAAALEDLCS